MLSILTASNGKANVNLSLHHQFDKNDHTYKKSQREMERRIDHFSSVIPREPRITLLRPQEVFGVVKGRNKFLYFL